MLPRFTYIVFTAQMSSVTISTRVTPRCMHTPATAAASLQRGAHNVAAVCKAEYLVGLWMMSQPRVLASSHSEDASDMTATSCITGSVQTHGTSALAQYPPPLPLILGDTV